MLDFEVCARVTAAYVRPYASKPFVLAEFLNHTAYVYDKAFAPGLYMSSWPVRDNSRQIEAMVVVAWCSAP